jgi:hypothetical protein
MGTQFKAEIKLEMSTYITVEGIETEPDDEWADSEEGREAIAEALRKNGDDPDDWIDNVTIHGVEEYCSACNMRGFLFSRCTYGDSDVYQDMLHIERCDKCEQFETDYAAEKAALIKMGKGEVTIPVGLVIFGADPLTTEKKDPFLNRMMEEAESLKSEDGENPEYDRALCELVGSLIRADGLCLEDAAKQVAAAIGVTL